MRLEGLCVLALVGACGGGGSDGAAGAPGMGDSCSGDGGCNDGVAGGGPSDELGACSSEVDVPWLHEGNFWQVSWAEIDYQIGLFDAGGDFDVGSYSMQLDEPSTVDGFEMFPILLSGDTAKYAPLWTSIGSDGCGTILASDGGAPVPIFSLKEDVWTGRGFWTAFAGYSEITVDRGASVIPSQRTKRIDTFEPPVTSVGYSASESGIGAGTGCEYFEGYGTVCGSDDPGGSTREFIFEYWDDDAGPIAMAYGYDYDSGGSLSTERHAEQRVEVWFFGDVAENNFRFESEPDSCIDPTPLPIPNDERIFTMFGEVNRFDEPGGAIAGECDAVSDEVFAQISEWYPFDQEESRRVAAGIHDWFSFEVVDPESRIEFYLVWDEPDVELKFYWFAAPDSDTGFISFGEDYIDVQDAFSEFEHVKGIPNPTTAGRYLLGVQRVTDSEFATQYGIFVLK